ncbi:MAG: site-specific integrase [Pseudomonadota bacterium]
MNPVQENANEDDTTSFILFQGRFLKKLARVGKTINTIKNYKTDLDCFNQYIQKKNQNLDLRQFTDPDVTEYHHYLLERYQSDNSRRRRVQTLRIFFDFLMEENLYPSNPVRALPTSPKFLDIPRPTPFIDIKTLWQYLLEESRGSQGLPKILALRNQVIVLLIFGAGLKVSDLARIPAGHIQPGIAPRTMVSPPKRDPYTIPLPEIFNHIWEEYSTLLTKMKMDAALTFDEALFSANAYQIIAGGISPRGVEILFEEYRKKLMIVLTPKSLRQACIFKWIQEKKNDTSIKEWLGVAPSYGLGPYKDGPIQQTYNEESLAEIYWHYKGRHRKV